MGDAGGHRRWHRCRVPGRAPGGREDGSLLLGRPDFLVRSGLLPAPDGASRPAGVHYEVVDAKLARSAKARAVAQVGFYSGLLAGAQGVRPRWMHLALGNGEFTSLKTDDYAAYERRARRLLGDFVARDPGENPPSVPYPEKGVIGLAPPSRAWRGMLYRWRLT